MQYRYITDIGIGYSAEENTPGLRNNILVWTGIQNKLKKAILDLRATFTAPANAPAPDNASGGSIAQRMAFFEQKHNGGETERLRTKLKAEIDRLRKWLKAEGAKADRDGNILMGELANLVVVYDHTMIAQGATQVHINGGRLFSDAAFTTPLDTEKMVTHFSGPGHGIFVMSATGNIHVISHVIGHRHHSSLLAGQPVASAGEIKVMNGYVQWLSNKSGHYRPNPDHLMQVLHQLQKNGVTMDFGLTVFKASGPARYAKVGDYLAVLESEGQPDYELGKLLRYAAHLTDAILGSNGWRWRNAALGEPPMVHTIAGNNPVPHKTVRQWMKANGYNPTTKFKDGWS